MRCQKSCATKTPYIICTCKNTRFLVGVPERGVVSNNRSSLRCNTFLELDRDAAEIFENHRAVFLYVCVQIKRILYLWKKKTPERVFCTRRARWNVFDLFRFGNGVHRQRKHVSKRVRNRTVNCGRFTFLTRVRNSIKKTFNATVRPRWKCRVPIIYSHNRRYK